MKNKTIVITGGAGYIGSVLTGQLLQAGYTVRVVDRLLFGDKSIKSYQSNPRFVLHQGDITDQPLLDEVLKGADGVVHLAAIVGDPACAKNPEEAVRTNRDGSLAVLRAAQKQKVPRFVFASTCSNYGRMDDPEGFVDESAELKPVSLYAELKVAFEQELLSLKDPYPEPVCLRFATAYGLSPRPRFDLTVNEFTRDLYLQRMLEIFGESFWRPYCHTTDLADACVRALEADGGVVKYQAFNVGRTDQNFQKKTLIEHILNVLPEARQLVRYVHKTEDPRDYRVDFTKINSALGYMPKRTIDDGIKEIIDALRSGEIQDPDDKRYANI